MAEPALDDDMLAEAVGRLRRDEVIGVPTDTVYGLAARLSSREGVARLFDIKRRDDTKAIAVLVSSIDQAREIALFSPVASALAAAFWPGPLTLVMDRRPDCDADLGGDPATIGVRQPDNEVVAALCDAVGPLATTSANLSGNDTTLGPQGVLDTFGDAVSMAIEAPVSGATASTVVDARRRGDGPDRTVNTASSVLVLREGPIPSSRLDAVVANLT